ncbi:MAG: hypothetical protein Q8R55_08160 [Candidatus Taylorbacteria bacterium]|nr:hypothetical protein [Candidatus Taylorbacteria bacterium]
MPKNSNRLSDNIKIWFFGSAILGLSFLIFGNSIQGNFIYDDHIVLSHSLFNQPGQFFQFFTEPYFDDYTKAGLYRPFTQISFVLNFVLGGANPAGFHVFNILLHGLNSFLVFIFAKEWLKSAMIGVIASLLFLVLPIHSEAVASIVGRAELLAFFFSVLSLIFWGRSRYLVSAVFLFCGLLSKETAIVVPLIIGVKMLYDRIGQTHKSYIVLLKKLLYPAGVIGAYFGLRAYVLKEYAFRSDVEFVFNPLAFLSVSERLATAFKILALYVQKIFIPGNLSPDYSYNQIVIEKSIFSSVPAFLGFLFLAVGLTALIYFMKRGRFYSLVLALTLFILPYLVISNLFFPIGTIMADRLMYLPSLGTVLLISSGFYNINRQDLFNRSCLLICGGIIVVYSFLTFQQNKIWADEEIFFQNMYERSPESVVAKTQWARLIYFQKPEEAKKLAFGAYAQYQDFIPLLNLLAAIEKNEGRPSEAIKYLERAHKLMPLHQGTLTGLSRAYFVLKEYQKAEPVLETLVSKYGGNGNIILYMITKARIGDYKEALIMIDKNIDEIDAESSAVLSEYVLLKMSKNPSSVLLKKAEEKLIKLETFFR